MGCSDGSRRPHRIHRRLHNSTLCKQMHQPAAQGHRRHGDRSRGCRRTGQPGGAQLPGALGIEDQRRQLLGRRQVEALGHEDLPAAGGDDHRPLIGGEDLLGLPKRFPSGAVGRLRPGAGPSTCGPATRRTAWQRPRRRRSPPRRQIEESDGLGAGLLGLGGIAETCPAQ